MANKIKKVSVNELEKYVKGLDGEETVSKMIGGMEVVITRRLSLQDMLEFADTVVKGCFRADDGSYLPEVKDFMVRSCVIRYYTNLSLPASVKARYDLLVRCDALLGEIYSSIDQLQYSRMIDAIDEKILYLCDARSAAAEAQAEKLMGVFEQLAEQMESVFGHLDGEAVSKVVDVLSGDRFSEKKLAEAVLEKQTDAGTPMIEIVRDERDGNNQS